MWKRSILLAPALLLAGPTLATAQSLPSGRWDIMSTAVDLDIPGAPGFLIRMMKGRSRTEHKCVTPEQAKAGVATLLAPDPKAKCQVDSVEIGGGRYAQQLSCPQKKGAPIKISRRGTYSDAGFVGQLQLAGTTPKGAMRIQLDQRATHVAGACRS